MSSAARERPLIRSRIKALLRTAASDTVSPEEARSSVTKARGLAIQYGFLPEEFQWPVAASDESEADQPEFGSEAAHEPPKRARGRGIGALARELILAHPDWTYSRIAAEVNGRIEGARSTARSVRWYSNTMRREGVAGTTRASRNRSGAERPTGACVIAFPGRSSE